MVYEGIEEESTYKTACNNVKKIANAIKAIKIKYYPNFAKITEEDKGKYDELNAKMESIVAENGLDSLKKALMEEISSKYDGKMPDVNEEDLKEPETRNQIFNETLLACYGAIDAETQAVSLGKLKKAIKCQEQRGKYEEVFSNNKEGKKFKQNIVEYKREKFAELSFSKELKEEKIERFEKLFDGYYTKIGVQQIESAKNAYSEAEKEMLEEKEIQQEEVIGR